MKIFRANEIIFMGYITGYTSIIRSRLYTVIRGYEDESFFDMENRMMNRDKLEADP